MSEIVADVHLNDEVFKTKLDDLDKRWNRFRQSSTDAGNVGAKAFDKLNASAGLSRNTMMALGGIVQDIPYGMRGIANNIDFFTQSMVQLQAQTGGIGATFRSLLSTLNGPMGILFAISAINSLWIIFSNASQSAGAKAKEAIHGVNLELENTIAIFKRYDDMLSRREKEVAGFSDHRIANEINQRMNNMLLIDEKIKLVDQERAKASKKNDTDAIAMWDKKKDLLQGQRDAEDKLLNALADEQNMRRTATQATIQGIEKLQTLAQVDETIKAIEHVKERSSGQQLLHYENLVVAAKKRKDVLENMATVESKTTLAKGLTEASIGKLKTLEEINEAITALEFVRLKASEQQVKNYDRLLLILKKRKDMMEGNTGDKAGGSGLSIGEKRYLDQAEREEKIAEESERAKKDFALEQMDALDRARQQELEKYAEVEGAKDKINEKYAKLRAQRDLEIAQNALQLLAQAFPEIKAFAVAEAIINTYLGATKALASAPPPFNIILMGATIAAGLAQVAKITETKGYLSGGYTGNGNPNDIAGVVHNREIVFEEPIVRNNKAQLMAIRSALKSGASIQGIMTSNGNNAMLILELRNMRKDIQDMKIQPSVVIRGTLSGQTFLKEEMPKFTKYEKAKKV